MAKRRFNSAGPEANFQALLRKYRASAKKRRLPFRLSISRFRELTSSPCFVCGLPPSMEYRHELGQKSYRTPYIYSGVDRINNKRGYVEGNVAACCHECNFAKGQRSLTDLLLYINRAYLYAIQPLLKEVDDE